MVTLKRPEVPDAAQRSALSEWKSLLALWDSGNTAAQIAAMLDVSRQAVDKRLRKAMAARQRGWI